MIAINNFLFSLCENPNLSGQVLCKKKKQSISIVLAVSIPGIFILLSTVSAVLWVGFKRKKQHAHCDDPFGVEVMQNSNQNSSLEAEGQRFTYPEIVEITNNFASIIGRGGFGEVYFGTLQNQTQVAVKLLISSSTQGSKEFENEVAI